MKLLEIENKKLYKGVKYEGGVNKGITKSIHEENKFEPSDIVRKLYSFDKSRNT